MCVLLGSQVHARATTTTAQQRKQRQHAEETKITGWQDYRAGGWGWSEGVAGGGGVGGQGEKGNESKQTKTKYTWPVHQKRSGSSLMVRTRWE